MAKNHTCPLTENVYENVDELFSQEEDEVRRLPLGLVRQGRLTSNPASSNLDGKSTARDKKPPLVATKTWKAVKAGGQPLPGMVRSCSLPESNQESGRGMYAVQSKNVEDGIKSMALQCTSQSLVESKNGPRQNVYTKRKLLIAQHTWHGDSDQTYAELFQSHQASQNRTEYIEWWFSEETQEALESSDMKKNDANSFEKKANNLKRALYVYDYLLSERGANLQSHIFDLEEVAKDINKVHKGVRIARITGGTAGAVGVAAAVGGVILSPFTMGASLAVAAVGVGVAAAGGVTGASAAITNKVCKDMDRNKVEAILKEHCTQIQEIERCVKFIGDHIECLKKYNLSTLRGVDWEALKTARIAYNLGDSVGAIGAASKSSGMIEGFALGLDMYFDKEDQKQLKKGSETKFARQIRKVVKKMQSSLDELMKFKTMVESADI